MTRIGKTFEQELTQVDLGEVQGGFTPTTISSLACLGWSASLSASISAVSVVSVVSYTITR